MSRAEATPVRTLKFEFPDLKIGTAEYADGPTGCTVLYFEKGAKGAVDIRGGAAAVRESSSLSPTNTWGYLDALVLAGGSTFGLEAADGVMEALLEARGHRTDFDAIPAVPAAIVYDFAGRENSLYPDKALGKKAFLSAKAGEVALGRAGGGANTTVGKYFGRAWAERSGQGAAFYEKDGVRILVLTVLNAVGNIVDPDTGKIVAGSLDPETQQRFSIPKRLLELGPREAKKEKAAQGNTTVTAVVTNVKLTRPDLQRLAVMSHTAMGRSIVPFHTPSDGDSLFAVSTGAVKLPEGWETSDVGTIAGELLQKAIHSALPSTPDQGQK